MSDAKSHHSWEMTATQAVAGRRVFTAPHQLGDLIHGLSPKRISEAETVSQTFRFRLPEFYFQNVLTGTDDDPLLDIVFPTPQQLYDGPDLCHPTPSPY